VIGTVALARLLAFAALLTLIITTASAYLRLGGNALGCEGWPACYVAAAAPQAAAPELPAAQLVRGAHRIAASVLGLLIIAIVVLGWDALQGRGRRSAGVALLFLALFLAWLGRYTPSLLPAVTLGNLLGGMTLFGLIVWLQARQPADADADSVPAARLRLASGVVLAVIVVQVGLGALLSVRHGTAACSGFPLCGPGAGMLDWSVFDPFALPAEGAPYAEVALQALQLAHRLGALMVVAAAGWMAWAAARFSPAPRFLAPGIAAIVLLQVLAGFAVLFGPPRLAAGVAHNLATALLVGCAAWSLRLPRRGE
jgi:heme a synthase